MPLTRGILLLAWLLLSAAIAGPLLASGAAHGQAADSAPASRRLTDCRFLVLFPEDSYELGESALAVIANAVNEATHNGQHRVRVYTEGQRHLDLVVQQVNRIKAPEDQVSGSTFTRVSDSGSPNAVYLDVCAPIPRQQERLTQPAEPERLVEFVVGQVRLAIPLRYLGPRYWNDPPREIHRERPSFGVGWPQMSDATNDPVRHCFIENISCPDVILIDITPVNPTFATYKWNTMDCCATNGSSLLLRVPGIAGASFFVEKYRSNNYPLHNLYLSVKTSTGQTLYGNCLAPSIPPEALRSSRTIQALLMNGGTCGLNRVPVGRGLQASISFTGSLFPQWQKILTSTASLVSQFEVRH